jgi:hypothetical protein
MGVQERPGWGKVRGLGRSKVSEMRESKAGHYAALPL